MLWCDLDPLPPVAALGRDTWPNTWLQLAHVNALNGRATVVCGSLRPEQLERLPGRGLVARCITVFSTAPDEILANRTSARRSRRPSSPSAAAAS
jgi:hypothetical protein